MIKINSLHKFFNKGHSNEIHVINDVSLELPQKGMVAIFGKSGCGKTTLLNVIGGLDKYNSGSLSVKGEEISKNADYLRNKYMGYIFQNYNLCKNETCAENVADALLLCGITDKKVIEERVNLALKNVDMDKYANRTPNTLSGGQQQRIAIARAIVKNPPIILADEPTGNLDEANTVMIMDLLKEISKEHLVLLVTHEANLVDYYCDMVIELFDGKVINVKKNENAVGFLEKDKNAIYLGEFEKKEIKNDNLEIEYYGEKSHFPLKLKVVNKNGKIYLSIDSKEVQILDDSSEIKLKEGVFKKQKEAEEKKNNLQMTGLPPISGNKMGRLFNFKKSFKSGYEAISKKNKKKKNKKTVKMCMGLFAAVLVFMSASLGTVIEDIINVKESINPDVFYVKTSEAGESEKLLAALSDSASGIDFVTLSTIKEKKYLGDINLNFESGAFESFSKDVVYTSTFETNVVYLSEAIASKLPLVAGKNTGLSEGEGIISTASAKKLLKNSSLGYIKEYKDILGFVTESLSVNGKKIKIVGIVETNNNALYLRDVDIARIYYKTSNVSVNLATDFDLNVAEGETVLILKNASESIELPALEEIIKINGKELKLKRILRDTDYDTYLKDVGIEKKSEKEYFDALIKETYPTVSEDSENYKSVYDTLRNEKFGEYIDYHYSEAEKYLEQIYMLNPSSYMLWLYFEKNIPDVKFLNLSNDYYAVSQYKEEHGKLPTYEEIKNYVVAESEDVDKYRMDFYLSGQEDKYVNTSYLVSEKDYIAISRQNGGTQDLAEIKYNDVGYNEYQQKSRSYYSLVHSVSAEKTEEYLKRELSGYDIITPDDLFDKKINSNFQEIFSGLSTMLFILVIMSLCMYFIMRSSLMGRVKEIGIYRAIGTSKKNLVFRFLVESLVLVLFTVFMGYLFSSLFIWACFGISAAMETVFFYPLWYSLLILVIMFAICIFSGIIPIISIITKPPAQILAKYDI